MAMCQIYSGGSDSKIHIVVFPFLWLLSPFLRPQLAASWGGFDVRHELGSLPTSGGSTVKYEGAIALQYDC